MEHNGGKAMWACVMLQNAGHHNSESVCGGFEGFGLGESVLLTVRMLPASATVARNYCCSIDHLHF